MPLASASFQPAGEEELELLLAPGTHRERSRFLGSSMASPMKAELALVVPVAPAKCNTVVFVTK